MLDLLFTAGLLFLVVFTPFAFGSVLPWAYTTMEVVIFLLLIVWMAKLLVTRGRRSEFRSQWEPVPGHRSSSDRVTPYALPITLFLALVLFQLMPLPPALLKIVSPQTFETYSRILPGWPERVPYAELAEMMGDGRRVTEAGLQSLVSGHSEQKSEVGEQGARSGEQSAKGQEQSDKSEEQSGKGEKPKPNTQNLTPSPESGIANPKSKIENLESSSRLAPRASRLFPGTWLPLSLSSNLTKIDLLRFAAFAVLFFLVWRYPFEKPFEDFGFLNSNPGFFILSPEQRFLRSVVFTVLGTGLLVAAFGFIARFAWNGNILLFVAGYDSQAVARASGPFINPDHFANYLSLIFPLALGVALFRTFMVPKSGEDGLKIFCAFTTFLLFTGILLSLSRAGWMNALLGIAILAWLAPWGGARGRRVGSMEHGARSGSPRASRLTPHAFGRVARLSLITFCVLLIVSLFIAGESGREQVDARLEETLERDTGLAGRVTAWKDSLDMIRDFPLIGVGLGAWGDVFKRYEAGPWSSSYYNEAHNDYIELLAETGIAGFGLLAWFFFRVGRRLTQGIRNISSKNIPLLAGILSALAGMVLHSWLDFSLQIPANALLFTVLLALGMRLAARRERSGEHEVESLAPWEIGDQQSAISAQWSKVGEPRSEVRDRRSAVPSGSMLHALSSMRVASSRFMPYALSALAVFLIGCAVTQEEEAPRPRSVAEAKERLLARPFKASYHLSVIRRMEEDAPLEWRLREYKAAHWIQPTNPYIRDQIAATLTALGRTDEALKEMSQSVAHAPSLERHEYLSAESLPQLSAQEQDAVEKGFKQALAWDYPEALNGLAEFYAKLERFADQAALYEQAAARAPDPAKKAELLIQGGLAFLRAERAEQTGDGRQMTGSGPQSLVAGHQSAKGEAPSAKRVEKGAGSQQRGNATSPSSVPGSSDQLPAPSSMLHAASAERLFRAAVAATPRDPKPYQHLVAVAYGAESDPESARSLVAKAIENGAPPLPLYLSLAEAAHKSGEPEESRAALGLAKKEVETLIKSGENAYSLYMSLAEGARLAGDRDEETAVLLKALDLQPRSPETLKRLADVYSVKRNYDRVTLYLNRIANINPNSPEVFFRIALAEEARYRFAAAGRAYAKAVELAPGDARYKERYDQFRERVERNRSTGDGGQGTVSRGKEADIKKLTQNR